MSQSSDSISHLAVLGSTGTIGQAALDVVRRNPSRFRVVALSAHRNIDLLKKQIVEFKPEVVAVADEGLVGELKTKLAGLEVEIVFGKGALSSLATHSKISFLVMGIVGYAALEPLVAAIESGIHIALANKESMVAAGELVQSYLAKSSSKIVPVDSEHSSIFQLLRGSIDREVLNITLTASGGPFWLRDIDDFQSITPEEAVKHPRWNMGAKISVDSATMMNKGLEVIEAHYLFKIPEEDIRVLVHPNSLVHGLVDFTDGTQTAVLYQADMRVPLAYAMACLSSPEPKESIGVRVSDSGVSRLKLEDFSALEFYAPDDKKFPALPLCRSALKAGGASPCILNAANEIAVQLFLDKQIRFVQIVEVVDSVLSAGTNGSFLDISDVRHIDSASREKALEIGHKLAS